MSDSITAQVITGAMTRVTVQLEPTWAGWSMTLVRIDPDGSESAVMGATGVPAVSSVWDDAEVTLGRPVAYRVRLGASSSVGPSEPVTVSAETPILSDPYRRMAVPVLVAAEGQETQHTARAARVDVVGRRERVHLWDVEASATSSPQLITRTANDRAMLDQIMASGDPWLLRCPCPDVPSGWRMRVGDRTVKRITRTGPGRLHTISDVDHLPAAPVDSRPRGDTLGDIAAWAGEQSTHTLGGIRDANQGGTLGGIAATDKRWFQ